ncbi:hypothetical protein PR048_006207 [Dryococelus australis]|uniref:Uncharacterized protein n=1 Tax=Dryococelus australis TaxID=614101 RepID=A0ABQ9IAC3_9NEOP|nr:hypothetical protein PR048_006207 [Dryococelus australis]
MAADGFKRKLLRFRKYAVRRKRLRKLQKTSLSTSNSSEDDCMYHSKKKVREVTKTSSMPSSSEDDFVVAEVNINGQASVTTMVTSNSPSCERKNLCVNSISHKSTVAERTAKIELDTEAQANLIPVKLFQVLNVSHKHLLWSNVRLVNYLEEKIIFLGKSYLKCTYDGRVRVLEFYVVEKDSSPILGLSACVMLYLARKVETVQSKTRDSNLADLISMYPQCFEGIGELPGDYKMILREDAKPVVHALRRVAAALRDLLRQ